MGNGAPPEKPRGGACRRDHRRGHQGGYHHRPPGQGRGGGRPQGAGGSCQRPGKGSKRPRSGPTRSGGTEDACGATRVHDPILGRASLVATAIDVLPESRNVVPDEVVVVVDWRVLPGSTDDELLGSVEKCRRRASHGHPAGDGRGGPDGQGVSRRHTRGRPKLRDLFTPGFLMDADDPVIQAAATAVGKRKGVGPAEVRPWTFATDGGWSRGVFGIPTLGFAPGEERFAHTNRERLDLEEARWAFSRHPDLVLAVQQGPGMTRFDFSEHRHRLVELFPDPSEDFVAIPPRW